MISTQYPSLPFWSFLFGSPKKVSKLKKPVFFVFVFQLLSKFLNKFFYWVIISLKYFKLIMVGITHRYISGADLRALNTLLTSKICFQHSLYVQLLRFQSPSALPFKIPDSAAVSRGRAASYIGSSCLNEQKSNVK